MMGRKARWKPARLAEKLLRIRKALGVSQKDMPWKLGLSDELVQANISQYEAGVKEPTLRDLLKYARLAKVYVDVLIDDDIDLPEKLPAGRKSMGIRKQKSWQQPDSLRRLRRKKRIYR